MKANVLYHVDDNQGLVGRTRVIRGESDWGHVLVTGAMCGHYSEI